MDIEKYLKYSMMSEWKHLEILNSPTQKYILSSKKIRLEKKESIEKYIVKVGDVFIENNLVYLLN